MSTVVERHTRMLVIRFINEDAYLELPKEKLWVVADGMGGHKRGDYASKAIINCLQSFSRKKTPSQLTAESLVEDIQVRLVEANDICQKAFRARRVGSLPWLPCCLNLAVIVFSLGRG